MGVENTALIYCALLAGCLMLAAHYIAPRIKGDDIHPIIAYVVGCTVGIMLPFGAWCLALWTAAGKLTVPTWLAFVGLTAVIVGAGAGTGLGYLIDWWFGYRAEKHVRG